LNKKYKIKINKREFLNNKQKIVMEVNSKKSQIKQQKREEEEKE
jgi:hypothetical protein